MEDFTLFSEHKDRLVKIIGQNHQFLGVNNAIASMLAIRERSAGLRPAEGGARLRTSRLAGTLAPPTNADVLRLTEPRSTANPNGIGVFWQTQGSGKSFSMVFFAQKVLRKVASNWTFVVVTDRVELDDQIAKTFKATGAVSEAEGDQGHAASGAHLRERGADEPVGNSRRR